MGVTLRIHFHLKSAQEEILDHQGVEVSGPEEARVQALMAVEELHQEEVQDRSGWRLVATDSAGEVVFTLDLDRGV